MGHGNPGALPGSTITESGMEGRGLPLRVGACPFI
jgi:hypothetical protein